MSKSTSSPTSFLPGSSLLPASRAGALRNGGACRLLRAAAAALCLAGIFSCGRSADPVDSLIRDLGRYPEYSLIVDDLRVEDGFFPDYFMRFRVLTASGQRIAGRDTLVYEPKTTDWMEVPEETFARYQHYLGMVVSSKSRDGRTTGVRQAHPPAYQYVGNSHYGYWGGGGFWQFYGQYAFMSQMLGGWGVGRNDYQNYRRNYERGRPYFGPKEGGRPAFGTRGSVTQKTRPGFYNRYRQRVSSGGRGFGTRARSASFRGGFGRGK